MDIDYLLEQLSKNGEIDQLLDQLTKEPYRKEFSDWLQNNLLTKQEVMPITKQSLRGVTQSIQDKQLLPFYSSTGKGAALKRLFLKSDVEDYSKRMRKN